MSDFEEGVDEEGVEFSDSEDFSVVDLSYGGHGSEQEAWVPIIKKKHYDVKSLHMSNNSLKNLTLQLDGLNHLQVLDASFNMLQHLPPTLKYLNSLVELDCRSNELTAIPAELAKCVNLKRMLLYKNNLSALPDIFSSMKQLDTLDVSCNAIKAIPPSVFTLTMSLIILDLENNLMTEIPAAIGSLRSLKKLCLAKNRITKIPAEFSSLTHLQELDLSSNAITALPAAVVSGLVELRECYLQKNLLAAIPPTFGDLKKLEVLDLRKNPLEKIPTEIRRLTVLEEIRVDIDHTSTLKQPPPSVCRQGITKIFAYLEELSESTPQPENCYAEGPGLVTRVSAQEKLSFYVIAVDKNKNLKSSGGDSFAVSVELMDEVFDDSSTIVSQPAKSTITDLNDGRYLVEYDATKHGFYSIRVRLNQKHIRGSPFRVAVAYAALDPTRCTLPLAAKEGEAGVEQKVQLTCYDMLGNRMADFEGNFEAKVLNDGSKPGYPASSHVKLQSEKNLITYLTTMSGQYLVDVSFNGVPIKDSPFDLRVNPTATYASNCLVSSPNFMSVEAGTLTSFAIQARDKYQNLRQIGGDVFTVVLNHQTHPEIVANADVVDNLNGDYHVSYTVKQPGTYSMAIKLQQPSNTAGRGIAGSPFDIEAIEHRRPISEIPKLPSTEEGVVMERRAPKIPAKPALASRPMSTVDDMRRKYEDLNVSVSSPGKADAKKFTLLPSTIKALRFPESEQNRFILSIVNGMASANMAIQPAPGHMIYMTLVYYSCQNQLEKIDEVLSETIKAIRAVINRSDLPTQDLVFWLANTIHLLKSLEQDEGGKWRIYPEAQGKPEEGTEVDQKSLKHLTAPARERLKDLANEAYQLAIKSVQSSLTAEKLTECFLEVNSKKGNAEQELQKQKRGSGDAPVKELSPDERQGMRVELGKMAGEKFGQLVEFIQKLNPNFEKSPTVEENVRRISVLEPVTLREVEDYMNTLTRYPADIWEKIGLGPVTKILTVVHTAMVVNNLSQGIIGQFFSQIFHYIDAILINNMLVRIGKDRPVVTGRDQATNIEGNAYALEEWAKSKGIRELISPLATEKGVVPSVPSLSSSSSLLSLSSMTSTPPPSPLFASKDLNIFLQHTRQAALLLQLSVHEIRQAKEVVTRFPILNQHQLEKLVRMMMEFDKEITMQHMTLIVEFAKIRKKKKVETPEANKFVDAILSPKLIIPPGRAVEVVPIPEHFKFGFEIETLALSRTVEPGSLSRSSSFHSNHQLSGSQSEDLSSLASGNTAFPNNPLQSSSSTEKTPVATTPSKKGSNFSFFHQLNGD